MQILNVKWNKGFTKYTYSVAYSVPIKKILGSIETQIKKQNEIFWRLNK
jgi:hypothetical protein